MVRSYLLNMTTATDRRANLDASFGHPSAEFHAESCEGVVARLAASTPEQILALLSVDAQLVLARALKAFATRLTALEAGTEP